MINAVTYIYATMYSFIIGEYRPTAYKLSKCEDGRFQNNYINNRLKEYKGSITNVSSNKILSKYK